MDLELLDRRCCIDVMRIIYSYIPKREVVWVTKQSNVAHHDIVQELMVEKRVYDAYIRMVMRVDLDFVMTRIMTNHTNPTWGKRKYTYKKTKYTNYYHFMDCYMFDNNAHKCRDLLFSIVYKKQYKKIHRHIPWTN